MFTSMSLTISGLVFVSLILTVYLTRKKYSSVENNLYRVLLILTAFLLVLEVVCVYTMSIRSSIPVLNEFLCRLYILGDVVWFNLLVNYLKVISDKEKYQTMQDIIQDKFSMFLGISSCVSFFISCLLEMRYTSGVSEELYVIGGKSVYVLYFVFALVAIYIFKILFKNLNKDTLLKKLPIFTFMVSFVILGIIQLLYEDFNDLTFLFALCVVTIYFTIENQDSLLALELEKAKKQSEKADREKTEFLSKMSHEIRTPMNAIMGFSESILGSKKLEKEDTIKDVKNIYNAGKSLLEIINNILVFSRMESGKEVIEEVEYNLIDIISELESYIYTKIDNKEVKFILDIDENMPAKYYGDKLKIYRIILNLLNNSVKYTESGTITLSIGYKKDEESNEHIIIKVIDTGYGMKEEEFNKVTDEFESKEDVLGESSGPGLGLSVVKKISEMLNAKITFNSKLGVGTEFDVDIIQKSVDKLLVKDIKKDSELAKDMYFDCSKYKILIVDDNNLNLKVTGRLLEHYNVKYDTSVSGKECVEKIKSGEKYDLILLDHLMPELDGIETIRILKRLDVKKVPPVVVMTANVVTELKDTYINEGFDDYIAKPIDIKELNSLMNKYFRKKSRKKVK